MIKELLEIQSRLSEEANKFLQLFGTSESETLEIIDKVYRNLPPGLSIAISVRPFDVQVLC